MRCFITFRPVNALRLPLVLWMFALVLLCTPLQAQVRVSGAVVHKDEPLAEVTIKVIKDGTVLRTMLADRKGRFETDIPLGKSYTLLFVRPFMLPVAIDVNTEHDSDEEVLYDVPLKMRMYNRYAGMSEAKARKSIGKISRTGTGEETFTFTPYAKVIEELKPLYAESERREALGEDPVASETFTIDLTEDGEASIVESTESAPLKSEVEKATPSDAEANEAPDRIGRSADRFEVVEQAKGLEREHLKESKNRSGFANQRSHQEGEAYIEASKELRRELKVEDDTRDHEIAEARIQKQAEQDQLLVKTASGPSPFRHNPISTLVKHSIDDGTFVYDERLLVEDDGVRCEYRKAVYNWLLFDVTYYSKDDKEISEEEFDEVKRTFGI